MTEWYVETEDGLEYYGEEYSQALSRARVTRGVLIYVERNKENGVCDWYRSENYGRTWEYTCSKNGYEDDDE